MPELEHPATSRAAGVLALGRATLARFVARPALLLTVSASLVACGQSAPAAPEATAARDAGAPQRSDAIPATSTDRPGNEDRAVTADASAMAYYLSMHGSAANQNAVSNTIFGVGKDGTLHGSVLGDDSAVKEPRGMALLADGTLLVACAWQGDTRILRYGPAAADGVRDLMGTFAQRDAANPAMVHTYAIAVAPDGSIYLSNQDTATVTRYAGVDAPTPGAPLPLPPSLSSLPNAPAGLFVASAKLLPGGLEDVRAIAFGPDGLLYVVDRGSAQVVVYDPASGARVKVLADKEDGLEHPIQIAFSPSHEHLFISDNGANTIFRIDLASGAAERFLPKHDSLSTPSAIVVGRTHLLVGDRKSKVIYRFSLPDGKRDSHPFAKDLPDAPEFLMWLPKHAASSPADPSVAGQR